MKIERFEEIQAWQAARSLAQNVYQLTQHGGFERDFGLRDQIQKATVSAMANIAKGFDGRSTQEFLRFLGYAFRSATEVQSHLYVALDQAYVRKEDFDAVYQQATEVKKLINGFIRYLSQAKEQDQP
jgi:four helix bundle protein